MDRDTEDHGQRPSDGLRNLAVLGAWAGLIGAFVAFVVALPVLGLSCVNTDPSEVDECRRRALLQFGLATVGFIPAVVLVVAALRGRRRLAALALVSGAAVYVAWAVLIDAMID